VVNCGQPINIGMGLKRMAIVNAPKKTVQNEGKNILKNKVELEEIRSIKLV
jgi:hypothetical protein